MISQERFATQTPTMIPVEHLPYRRVLVPLDGSALAEEALPVAVALVQHAEPGGKVILLGVHVTECIISSRGGPVAVPTVVPEEINAYLARLETALRARGVLVEVAHSEGDAARGMAALVRTLQADLLIMVSHAGGDVSRIVPGSVAEHVLQTAAIPVLLLKQGEGAALHLADTPRLVLRP